MLLKIPGGASVKRDNIDIIDTYADDYNSGTNKNHAAEKQGRRMRGLVLIPATKRKQKLN